MAKPGLSVLIPVYNFSIQKLISDLLFQLVEANHEFEICVYDDGSNVEIKNTNRLFSHHSGVVYKELTENIGRSKIRNLLAKEAVYEYILFLDCDCELPNSNYMKTYLDLLVEKEISAVNGGRKYKSFDNYKPENYLHWSVGKNREEKSANIRNAKPYGSFMLDNLLIKKSIFTAILLDENIKTYGHEDTKFGFELETRKIPVLHIDNPTYHIGLSNTSEFIEKTTLAVVVLCKIIETESIGKSTSLYKSYNLLCKFRLERIVMFVVNIFYNKIIRNLISRNPSLLAFDLFKLKIMLELLSKK